jgi:calcium-dependent protein kinase
MGTCSTNLTQQRFSLQRNPVITENSSKVTTKYRILETMKSNSDMKMVYSCVDMVTKIEWVMKKYIIGSNSNSNVLNEIEIHKSIESIHVVKIHEYFKTEDCVIVIYEKANGRKLFKELTKKKEFEAEEFENIFHQLVAIMCYMHQNGIMVRSLDPSNILYDGNIIKIISMSEAVFFKKGQRFKAQVTSPLFMSPEMVRGKYDYKSDIWAIGIISFIILTGTSPVEGESSAEIMVEIANKNFHFEPLDAMDIDDSLKQIIKDMLNPNLKTRIKFKQIMKTQWFLSLNPKRKSEFKRKSIFTDRLKEFSFKNKFIRTIHAFLIKHALSSEEKEKAMREFKKLDVNDDGCLDKKEFLNALQTLGIANHEAVSEEIFKKLDLNHNGQVEYKEFLELWIDRDDFFAKKNLKKYFDIIDNDKNGIITTPDLMNVFGEQTKTDYFKKYMKKYSKNEIIDFANFERMIKDLQPMM